MPKAVAITIALLLAGTGASMAATNPLLGNWVYDGKAGRDRDGTDWCAFIPRMTFTASSQTMVNAATKFQPQSQSTVPVTYFIAGPKVYVSQSRSFYGAPMYVMVDSNTVKSDTCIFHRQ